MKPLSFETVSDGQSNINITIKYVFPFLQIIIRSQKNLCEALKLKFILMFFDSVYPIGSSDTVTEYTIYPIIYNLQ